MAIESTDDAITRISIVTADRRVTFFGQKAGSETTGTIRINPYSGIEGFYGFESQVNEAGELASLGLIKYSQGCVSKLVSREVYQQQVSSFVS